MENKANPTLILLCSAYLAHKKNLEFLLLHNLIQGSVIILQATIA